MALLDANRGNVTLTAKQLSIPESTLRTWAKGQMRLTAKNPALVAEVACLRQTARNDMVAALEEVAWEGLETAYIKLPSASARDAMVSVGIALDHRRDLLAAPARQADDAVSVLASFTEDQLAALLSAWQETAARAQRQPTVTVDALAIREESAPETTTAPFPGL